MTQSPYQQSLELIKAGDWSGAHAIVQDLDTPEAALIHAYLHRVEGDIGNARYWYRRAGQEPFAGTLEKELENLVSKFFKEI